LLHARIIQHNVGRGVKAAPQNQYMLFRHPLLSAITIIALFRRTGIHCPEVWAPRNGEVLKTSLEWGAIVRFKCNEGYFLKGEDAIVCGDSDEDGDGEWLQLPPFCEGAFASFSVLCSLAVIAELMLEASAKLSEDVPAITTAVSQKLYNNVYCGKLIFYIC